MAYDDVLHVIGEFGPYQRRICLLFYLPMITSALQAMIGVFIAAETDFQCLQPHENSENATYQLSPNLKNVSHPWNYDAGDRLQCERYDVNLTDHLYDPDRNFSSTTPIIKCESFVYDKSIYELTTTSEFNLVCDRAWLRATADSQFLVGTMLGSMIFSALSDAYGRRPISCFTLFLEALGGFLVAVSPEIISYIIFRLIVGSAVGGIYLIAQVSVSELIVPERRLMVGVGAQLAYTFGVVLTTAFAYFIRNWRILQIAITVPNLGFLVYWWFIPESVRWLLSRGRLEEAKDLIHKASLENGAELPRDKLDSMLSHSTVTGSDLEERSVLDLFRYPNLRRKTLLLFFIWFINNCTYYGLSWNTSSLAGDVYLNFAISGLAEVPGLIFVLFTLDRFGRRTIVLVTFLISGAPLLLRIFVPDDLSWLEIVLTTISKAAVVAALSAITIFSTEQFPTVIRNAGIGACSTCAMMGAIISSYVNYSSVIWTPLPLVIYGAGSLIAALLVLLLPETMNEKLLDTIEDGEQFGKKNMKSGEKSSN